MADLTIVRPDQPEEAQPANVIDATAEAKNLASDPGVRTITTSDMIRMCQERAHHQYTSPQNRQLLMNCAFTIRQLVDHVAKVTRENAELRGIKAVPEPETPKEESASA